MMPHTLPILPIYLTHDDDDAFFPVSADATLVPCPEIAEGWFKFSKRRIKSASKSEVLSWKKNREKKTESIWVIWQAGGATYGEKGAGVGQIPEDTRRPLRLAPRTPPT